jgi:cytochrome c
MRTPIYICLAACLAFSCGQKENNGGGAETADAVAPAELSPVAAHGKEIFESTGTCVACHKPEGDVLAPSLAKLAAAYKSKPGGIVTFLKAEAEPIVDPGRFETMKTNFAITTTMSDDDLKSLEAYILTFAK